MLFRSQADGPIPFVDRICLETLTIKSTLNIRNNDDLQAPYMTVGFASDGDLFYLVRVGLPADSGMAHSESEKAILQVFVDIFQLPEVVQEDATLQLQSRVMITKRMTKTVEPVVSRSNNAQATSES